MTFLMEEHAPFLAPSDHAFPWGSPKGPSNTGPIVAPVKAEVSSMVMRASGAGGKEGNMHESEDGDSVCGKRPFTHGVPAMTGQGDRETDFPSP